MYLRKFAPALLVIFIAFPAVAGQQSIERMYQEARRHYYALFSSPKKMKDRKQWLRVISKFSIIARNRPNTKRGADAQYTVGLLYKNLYYRSNIKQDRKNSIAAFSSVVNNHPRSSLVDDAQKHIGDISFRDKDYTSAAKAYRSVSKRKSAKKISAKARSSTSKKRYTAKSSKHKPAKADAAFARLNQVRRYSQDGYTRMILYLSSRTAFRAERLKGPDRVFIDLLGAAPAPSVSSRTKYKSGLVRSMRMGKNSGHITRVVFDVAPGTYHRVTSLQNPFRIVIDFGRKKTVVASKKKTAPPAKPVKYSVKPKPGYGKVKVIVIDPGHGGRDPGAIGPSGVKEKNLTLALARKLKRKLEQKMNCKVYLTRNSDRFVELDARTVYANSLHADLFISVHTNSSRSRKAHGLETYFLSPARSKDELATAARENMIAAHTSDPAQNDLAYIMSDLTSTQKINDSVKLAGSVQRSMVRGLRKSYRGVKDKGVKQAMFHVLWRATMPSILVETGFISNRTDEGRLRNANYQDRIADAIANGVAKYSRTYQTAMAR